MPSALSDGDKVFVHIFPRCKRGDIRLRARIAFAPEQNGAYPFRGNIFAIFKGIVYKNIYTLSFADIGFVIRTDKFVVYDTALFQLFRSSLERVGIQSFVPCRDNI